MSEALLCLFQDDLVAELSEVADNLGDDADLSGSSLVSAERALVEGNITFTDLEDATEKIVDTKKDLTVLNALILCLSL